MRQAANQPALSLKAEARRGYIACFQSAPRSRTAFSNSFAKSPHRLETGMAYGLFISVQSKLLYKTDAGAKKGELADDNSTLIRRHAAQSYLRKGQKRQ